MTARFSPAAFVKVASSVTMTQALTALVLPRRPTPVCILGTADEYGVINRSIRPPHFPSMYCPAAVIRRVSDLRLMFPPEAGR